MRFLGLYPFLEKAFSLFASDSVSDNKASRSYSTFSDTPFIVTSTFSLIQQLL